MTAATNRVCINRDGPGPLPVKDGAPLAATTNVKEGWLLARNASGYAVAFTETTGLRSLGVATQDADNPGAAGDALAEVWAQVVDVDQSTAGGDSFVDADAPAVAFGVDNKTIGKVATGRSPAGIFFGINRDTGKARLWAGTAAAAVADALLGDNAALASLASTANGAGASLVGVEDAAGRIAGANVEAALAELAGRLAPAVADATAVQAITAAARANGQLVLKLDDNTLWRFDSGSSATASAYVIVPGAGTGRWVAVVPRQKGTATLVGGTVTVTGVTLTASSRVQVTRNTSGGTPGHLGAPDASRNVGAGSFVISSSSGTDTSTVDYSIEG